MTNELRTQAQASTEAGALIRADIFKTVGMELAGTVEIPFDNLTAPTVFKLNPAMCGPIGAIFTDIDVHIRWGVSVGPCGNARSIYIEYDYSYSHTSGGTNGYLLRKQLEFAPMDDES